MNVIGERRSYKGAFVEATRVRNVVQRYRARPARGRRKAQAAFSRSVTWVSWGYTPARRNAWGGMRLEHWLKLPRA